MEGAIGRTDTDVRGGGLSELIYHRKPNTGVKMLKTRDFEGRFVMANLSSEFCFIKMNKKPLSVRTM